MLVLIKGGVSFFIAAPAEYRRYWARGRIRAAAEAYANSGSISSASGKDRSLNQWARLGIELTS